MEERVLGCLITYDPDIKVLKANLEMLLKQTKTILIYDNGSANQGDIANEIRGNSSVRFIENGDNLGLPICYNKAMAAALRGGVRLASDIGSGYSFA